MLFENLPSQPFLASLLNEVLWGLLTSVRKAICTGFHSEGSAASLDTLL